MNSIEPQIEAQPRYLYNQSDEIDLIELFAIIWGGKWLILGLMTCSAAFAYFFISALPSIYQITATINETSGYELQAIQPSKLSGGEVYQLPILSPEKMYDAVLAQSESLFTKKSFWEEFSGEPLGDLQRDGELTTNEKDFLKFAESFSMSLAGENDQNSRVATLVLELKDREFGVNLLDMYLTYLDKKTVAKSLNQLQTGLEANLLRLEGDYESLKERELVNLEDQIVRLGEAYKLAESLNIVETPYEQVENVELSILDNRLYLLGTRVLGEELKSLETRRERPLEAFVPHLRNLELWKHQLKGDLAQINTYKDSSHAFAVISPAQSSLRPIKPNKMLLFVASVFAAGLVSMILVFVLHGVRNYKNRLGQV